MQAVKSNFSQICAQGLSNGYDVMLASLLLSLPSSCIHPWLIFLPNCRLISFFLKYLVGNRNENLKSSSNLVWAEGSLAEIYSETGIIDNFVKFPIWTVYADFQAVTNNWR